VNIVAAMSFMLWATGGALEVIVLTDRAFTTTGGDDPRGCGHDLRLPDLRDSDVYLVGSMAVPSDTVEEAMQTATRILGDRLSALPDGEVGQRSWWVAGLGLMVYSQHTELRQVGEDESSHPVDGPFGELGTYRAKRARFCSVGDRCARCH
jgi:hypothetical protein